MIYTTYLGLILAFFSVLLAIVLEGAAFTSFFKLSAILLILGGTLGATIASYSSDQVQVSLKIMKNVLNEEESIDIYEIFLRLLDKTRRDGLLSRR